MAEGLEQLETAIAGFIGKLGPGQRSRLARAIGVDLRRRQQRRIAEQRNPDGSRYAPRKKKGPPARAKRGRIRRRAAIRRAGGPMFVKLRKLIDVRASPSEVSVGFPDNATERIAEVHQLGLRDRVSREPGAAVVTYAARVLLGWSDENRDAVLDLVVKHLAP